jgi:transposase
LLVGLQGHLFHTAIDGSSNHVEFIRFFMEASVANTADGIPVLSAGDTVVLDNSPIHHNQAERILQAHFARMGVQLIFLPVYSPNLSPVESVFMKLKILLKRQYYSNLVSANLKVAICQCLREITKEDMRQFYKGTHIFDV